VIAKVNAPRELQSATGEELRLLLPSLRELQSQTQEELDALLPSVLGRAFKGEL
jgi:hypothetical protein